MYKNRKLLLLPALLSALLLAGCAKDGVYIAHNDFEGDSTAAFTTRELVRLVAGAKEHEGKRGATTFLLKRDTTLRNGAFSCRAKGANRFILAGADATAMSHAAYTLLERMGYRFDITETLRPTRYNLEGDSLSFSVTPATRYRGIRQHVNFPMDISSYRIEEAEAYVDNLLRLRFNKLTVHSYPGFWHVQPQGDTLLRAGNFFYDSPHRLTGSDILRRHVRDNEALFCIPEMEKLYFDLPEKSGRTIAWMRRLLQHAKERGMYLQFSIEPRLMGDKELDGVVRSIVKDYPMLDAIELMTEETGGWGPGCTRADVEKVLREDFGNEALADPVVTAAIRDRQADLAYLFKQEAENIRAIRRLSRDPLLKGKELKLGIYCTTFQAPAAYRLARLRAPELKVCIMPSHGSRGTNRALRGVVKTKADLAQTEIYNWIEFDGVMYLQQNAIEGIGGVAGYADTLAAADPVPSVCFNHWRTCENRFTARYAAEVAMGEAADPAAFYRRLAADIGIADAPGFAEAMLRLGDADTHITSRLGNAGFPWTGGWRGYGQFGGVNLEAVEQALKEYRALSAAFAAVKGKGTATPEARRAVELLENRTEASALYLEALRTGAGIRRFDSRKMDEKQRRECAEICNKALEQFDIFLEKYAALLPDRGSEGTLVSVWNAPVYGLKRVRQQLTGIPMGETWHNDRPADAPPLPIKD